MPYSQPEDYVEYEFPRNWPNDERIQFINEILADPNYESVELYLRKTKIIVRAWKEDTHLTG